MKALVVTDKHRPLESLEVVERPTPHLSENDVLVEVGAAGFTKSELEWPGTWTDRLGHDRSMPVPGHEMCGVVVELGYGTTGLRVGQRVAGVTDWTRDGTLAQYVAVEARNLSPVAPDIDDVTAAALPISALTAQQALFVHATSGPGVRVLVHGAAGAVGSIATQLAARSGAFVIGTGRSKDRDAVCAAGAHEFVAIDGTPDAALGAIGEVDVALDVLGGDVLAATVGLIRTGGSLVSIVGPPPTLPAGARFTFFVVEADGVMLARLLEDVRAGRLTPRVDAVCSLADAAAAFRAPGRTIVRMTDASVR